MYVLIALAALAVLALVAILLWGVILFVRKPKLNDVHHPVHVDDVPSESAKTQLGSEYNIPERAQAIFSGLNLDLGSPGQKEEAKPEFNSEDSSALADAFTGEVELGTRVYHYRRFFCSQEIFRGDIEYE
jgi:hypothetical protein